jgi:AP-1-like transcription factor
LRSHCHPTTTTTTTYSNIQVQKRKAQNRAAQRAFRERKEQHLKDLENKVKELEKASETANSENSQLRAQVEKITSELEEYKKRLSVMNTMQRSNPSAITTGSRPVFGSNLVNNLNDVNFQFEFPKFGVLPGRQSGSAPAPGSSPSFSSPTNTYSSQPTPSDKGTDSATPASDIDRDALSKFSSIMNASPYDGLMGNASRTSLDSTNFSIGGTNSGSPSASSNSNAGPSSSCGTSPEPFTQSPMGFKPVDSLTTIGEESHIGTNNTSHTDYGNIDLNFDWIAQQNGGQFDPQLFGGYREPQDNILANTAFDDSFFNEAFDADFATPFNVAPSPKPPAKKDICAEIDARKEQEDTLLPSQPTLNGKFLTCNNIWYAPRPRRLTCRNLLTPTRERLQTCPKVQSGDIDLDGLCSDLQKKAKCGGTGAVVDEKDFKAVMSKHLGPCPDEMKKMSS